MQCLEVIVILVRFMDGLRDLLGAQRREGESESESESESDLHLRPWDMESDLHLRPWDMEMLSVKGG